MNVEEIKTAARERMAEIKPLYDEYLALEKMLHDRVATPAPKGEVGQAAIGIVDEHAGEPVSAQVVHRELLDCGKEFTLTQISNALHHANRIGAVVRVDRGVYRSTGRPSSAASGR